MSVGTEFYAKELAPELLKRGFNVVIEQTGGGTATFYVSKGETDEYILGGPGSYDWENFENSTFTTDEFCVGEELFRRDGLTEKDDEPEGVYVNPSDSFSQIADLFVKLYEEANPAV